MLWQIAQTRNGSPSAKKQAESQQITQLTRICMYHCDENSMDKEDEGRSPSSGWKTLPSAS